MIRLIPRLKRLKIMDVLGLSKNSFRTLLGKIFKRFFDFTVALIGLMFLTPFFLIIAVMIKRDSPGPVFYWGSRIGRNGVIFKMLKFRTMYENPKSYRGPRVTCKQDDRITPLGKWLRDTKLNELPQLWNVLIGEMSMVGPRPEDPSISKTWPTLLAREILSVRPGITSPASILYRDEESMLHAGEVMQKYLHELSPDKMRLDQLYVRYRSFWLDLDVILWTILLLIPKIKAYSPPEKLLFVGPVTRLIHRFVSWLLWDFMIVLVAITFTGAVMRFFIPLDIGWMRAASMALACSLIYSLVGLFMNTNRINWQKAPAWEAGRIWAVWMVSTTAVLFFHFYLGFTSVRIYALLIGASILSLFGMIFIRYRWRLVSSLLVRLLTRQWTTHEIRERVLIVGSGRTAEHISWLMDHPTYARKFQIVGFIDDDLLSQGMNIYGSKVIGEVKDIKRIVKKRDIGVIVLADSELASHKYKEFHDTANFSPARIVVAPDLFGSLKGLDCRESNDDTIDNLNGFQCQNCLARYTTNHVNLQNDQAHDFAGKYVLTESSSTEERKNGKLLDK